jgi:DNA-directed RNA polymerase specialized sigma24 family protein
MAALLETVAHAGPAQSADKELVRAAVAREPDAVRELVRRLTPEVQSAVASVLLRGSSARGGGARREVEDLTQDVFLALFDKQGAALSRWDPEAGMSLHGFVRLAARRLTISILRSRVKNPFQHRLQDPSDFERAASPDAAVEVALTSRQALLRLLDDLRARLSPLGLEMFCRLFAWEQSVDVVCQETGLGVEAVYQWRSRLKKLVQQIAEQSAET